jgi:TatA/E family protein of Tat protein translocase
MGPVGWQEMVIIFVVALVLFGPKKLPELGRTIGKAITEFRRASNELKSTFEREMQTLERENESLKEVTHSYASEINNHYNDSSTYGSGYDSSYDYGAYGSEPYDSTASNPTTAGESAVQDAEVESTGQPAVNGTNGVPGTVARGTETASNTEAGTDPAANHAGEHEGAQKS